MKHWVVAAGLIEGPEGLLLVQNRRRDGRLDWSSPGDPDGIVVDARFFPLDSCAPQLDGALRFVREPFEAWLTERHVELRSYRYRADGQARSPSQIVRL